MCNVNGPGPGSCEVSLGGSAPAGCNALVLPVCVPGSGHGHLPCDLTSLMGLRSVDFSFGSAFSSLGQGGVSKLLTHQTKLDVLYSLFLSLLYFIDKEEKYMLDTMLTIFVDHYQFLCGWTLKGNFIPLNFFSSLNSFLGFIFLAWSLYRSASLFWKQEKMTSLFYGLNCITSFSHFEILPRRLNQVFTGTL